MKMKPYIWLITACLVILAVVIVLSNRWSTTGRGFASLTPPENSDIDMALLIHRNDTLRFVKEADDWKYEDEVLQTEAVENLIIASKELSLKSIVPFNEIDTVDYMLEIQLREGKKIASSFMFIRSGPSYLLFERGADKAYVVELLGVGDIPLEKYFSNDLNHYRKHVLISLLPSEIRKLVIEPLEGKPFILVQEAEGNFRVLEFGSNTDITECISERKIRMLLSYFTNIRYDAVIEGDQLVDRSQPDARIHVEDSYGKVSEMSVYQWKYTENQNYDIFEALVVFNGNTELLRVDFIYLDLLIRGLESYLKES